LFRRHDLRGLRDAASLAWALLGSLRKDGDFVDSAIGAARSGPDFWRFVTGLWERWELLDDLAPSRSLRLRRARRDVVRRSFVTVAGQRSDAATTPPADAFFLGLSERAAGTLSGCSNQGERVAASVQRLNAALESRGDLVIKADHVEAPLPIDAEANDGVVNSARQLFDPSDPDELAGIVVGDHFDVVGYYDRHAWMLDGDGELRFEQVLSGLLHSGSGFRDDQFFELYGRVANAVAGSRS
jgi:hypothetical protein